MVISTNSSVTITDLNNEFITTAHKWLNKNMPIFIQKTEQYREYFKNICAEFS